MSSPHASRWSTLAIVAAAVTTVSGCSGIGAQLAKPSGTDLLDRSVTQGPKDIDPHFALTDTGGQRLTEADFRGRPWLAYFGYTSCPQICGLELATMAAVADEVGADRLRLVFVTIDPQRDTAARLKAFTTSFHPEFVALRGNDAELSRAARAFGVYYRVKDGEGSTIAYSVEHSNFLYLFDDDGKFVRAFTYDTAPGVIASEARRLPTTLAEQDQPNDPSCRRENLE